MEIVKEGGDTQRNKKTVSRIPPTKHLSSKPSIPSSPATHAHNPPSAGQASKIIEKLMAGGFEVTAYQMCHMEKINAEEFYEVYRGAWWSTGLNVQSWMVVYRVGWWFTELGGSVQGWMVLYRVGWECTELDGSVQSWMGVYRVGWWCTELDGSVQSWMGVYRVGWRCSKMS